MEEALQTVAAQVSPATKSEDLSDHDHDLQKLLGRSTVLVYLL
jgi:hypothetical protein